MLNFWWHKWELTKVGLPVICKQDYWRLGYGKKMCKLDYLFIFLSDPSTKSLDFLFALQSCIYLLINAQFKQIRSNLFSKLMKSANFVPLHLKSASICVTIISYQPTGTHSQSSKFSCSEGPKTGVQGLSFEAGGAWFKLWHP